MLATDGLRKDLTYSVIATLRPKQWARPSCRFSQSELPVEPAAQTIVGEVARVLAHLGEELRIPILTVYVGAAEAFTDT